jgi:gamma-glutamyltranspeptidase/glutathione hydrolase
MIDSVGTRTGYGRAMPVHAAVAETGMVATVDRLATDAGVRILRAGGSAVDAAVAANAVLAVTCQHLCGLGGDLFALVAEPGRTPTALNASGRAGSGADPDRLRAEGHAVMPAYGDIRAVPVPGCVDGWLALHDRYGRLPLTDLLVDAQRHARDGFPCSPLLAAAAPSVAGLPGAAEFQAATGPGAVVRRPRVAAALAGIARDGRAGFYGGAFGEGLRRLGAGEFTAADLAEPQAEWVPPLSVDVWDRQVWTVPPNSQGYLTLAGAWIAAGLPLPADPADPTWAHLLVEAARAAAWDRLTVLHEDASGPALLDPSRLGPRRAAIETGRPASLGDGYAGGDTMFLCCVDADRQAVSLIQSNAAGFGCGIAEPATGVFLQNRGIGFSLEPGHPAEYGPRRRPPHTLSPALVTSAGWVPDVVLGTMGGDAQPQVLLQLLARLLLHREPVGAAIPAGRWALSGGGGFDTWRRRGAVTVLVEGHAPRRWADGLAALGHRVRREPALSSAFGHAQAIRIESDRLVGVADPRSLVGTAAGC